MLEDSTNKELLDAWKAGSQRAASLLVKRFMLRLTALARSRLSRKLARRLDPEDVVLSAWRSFFVAANADNFSVPADGNLWPLLATLTLRKVSRQVDRHTASRRTVADEVDVGGEDPWRDAVSRDPTPLEAAALVDEVESLMRSLSPVDRSILVSRLQGADQASIARQMHCSERTVRRAIERIRALIQKRESLSTRQSDSIAIAEPQETASHEWFGQESQELWVKQRVEDQPNISFADITLQKLIGCGGFGRVYRAMKTSDGSVYAVKYLKKRFWKDRRACQSLLEETRHVTALSHPGIIRHYGWGIAPAGALFVVMDWIDGPNLFDWRREQAPPIQDVLRCGLAVADAVAAAHAAGIVHGDLTPGNVLRRNGGTFVLTDFGFSKTLQNEPRGSLGGTPGFLAPEQVSDLFGSVSQRTDIYGFGGLLYWLSTGAPPTEGDNIPEILANVISSRPVRTANTLVAGIPHQLNDLLARCLRKEPGERPASMQCVRAELMAILLAE